MDVGAPALEADPVNSSVFTPGRTYLLHDDLSTAAITTNHFEPAWWRARNAEIGTATGRGTVRFVRAPDGVATWVLRHYLRGGWAARLSRDRYLWRGLEQTRAWREWRLTKHLHDRGLPVPVPVAARVVRHGLRYTADLITARIEDTLTLAQVLRERALPATAWQQLGATLRRLHNAGVRHDDLNVSNILVRANDQSFHVIDFDRAALVAPGAWRARNLARFRRSLDKHRGLTPTFAFTGDDWNALQTGYAATTGP